MNATRALFTATLALGITACGAAGLAEPDPSGIRLPDGFRLERWADVPRARSMVVSERLGAVIVGSRGSRIYAVVDDHKDGRADRIVLIKDGLKVPNGIDMKDGYLYVAEQHRIVRFKADSLSGLQAAAPEILYEGLPDKAHHGWRYARFAPDGALFVAVGAPCNICALEGLEGTILRFDPVTWQPEIYASGVRNSVGFDFHPTSGELYFTDNGADGMGDDSPPDELNHAPKAGLWFGYPHFGGGTDRTPDFEKQPLPRDATPPIVNFNAHVAALGISFYTGGRFPSAYHGDAFVAQRGSWNRTIPIGYRVMRIRMDGPAPRAEVFAEGWLKTDGTAWGRPVDVKNLWDGSILVSDDRAGAIWRISYRP